jgi:DNA processing protein
VEEVSDILDEVKGIDAMKENRKPSPSQEGPRARLGPRETHLHSLLSTTPVPLDELVSRSGYPVSVVSALLTLLEMKELARALPGNRFATAVPTRGGIADPAVREKPAWRDRRPG